NAARTLPLKLSRLNCQAIHLSFVKVVSQVLSSLGCPGCMPGIDSGGTAHTFIDCVRSQNYPESAPRIAIQRFVGWIVSLFRPGTADRAGALWPTGSRGL